MDNYVKFFSHVDPAADSGLLSVTVCRLLHIRKLPNQAALPPIVDIDHTRRLARLEVLTYHTSLMRLLDIFGNDAVDAHAVRVPNVQSLRWKNLAVCRPKIGEQDGLLDMLMFAKYVHDHSAPHALVHR